MVDGVAMPLAAARLAMTDDGVARGDGAFETIGVWDGAPFRLDDHLGRLSASLAASALPAADIELIATEARDLVTGTPGDAALRIYVTGSGTRVLTLAPQPVRPDPNVLSLQPGPWISPRDGYAAAGAKTMSYGPNMVATRRARAAGADDALLYSVPDRHVLEGPTFGVLFVARGVVHVPSEDLGIVPSISRRTLIEIALAHGLDVLHGAWPVDVLADADELIVSSSIRDAIAVQRVDGWTFGRTHPVRDMLSRELGRRRRSGSGSAASS